MMTEAIDSTHRSSAAGTAQAEAKRLRALIESSDRTTATFPWRRDLIRVLMASDLNEALIEARALRALTAQQGDPLWQGRANVQLARVLHLLGRYREAEMSLDVAQDLFIEDASDIDRAEWLLALALLHADLNRLNLALDHAERSLQHFIEAGDVIGQAQAERLLGATYSRMHLLDDAQRHLLRALNLANSGAQDFFGLSARATSLMRLGQLEQSRHRYDEALRYHHQALALSRHIEDRRLQLRTLNGAADAMINLGQLPEAIQSLEVAQRVATLFESPAAQGETMCLQAALKLRMGDAKAALQAAEEALRYIENTGTHENMPRCRLILRDAAKAVGDFEAALGHFEVYHTLQQASLMTMADQQRQSLGSRIVDEKSKRLALDRAHRQLEGLVAQRTAELAETVQRLEREAQERRAMTESLLEAKQNAETASRSKSEFLANISHELRTPLNAIIGFSEAMKLEMFGPLGGQQYCNYAADIHDSGHLLLSLINDILDLSKIEAGKHRIHIEALDLFEVLQAALRLVEQRARDGNLRLALQMPPRRPALKADRRAVTQMVLNLLTNAVKFTPAGGSILLSCSVLDDGVAITVEDTGIGMAPEDIPVALSAFGQLDNPYTRSHQGTGLGLPMVKALAEMHGGRFSIDSEPDHGTAVTIWLPSEPVIRQDLTADSDLGGSISHDPLGDA
jgi:signal transduction histidine kinase